jgi:hypothetical protein
MPRLNFFLPLALATLSATALHAQSVDPAGQTQPPDTQQPAPITRSGPASGYGPRGDAPYSTTLAVGGVLSTTRNTANAEPITGVYLRVAPNSAVREVSASPQRTEFRVERGIANVSVHHPDSHMLVLVDLPGGQVQLLKNGFYTFNAGTNTSRVLKGEADAFAGSASDAKPLKVKEYHAVTFPAAEQTGVRLQSIEFYPIQARGDIVSSPVEYARASDGPAYGYGYGYPAYGFGYGYPYGYPYGPYWDGFYGYPFGLGLGFGGFYGGGFYGGGFHSGGFHGRR